MRFFKVIRAGYITCVGKNGRCGEEITQNEYETLLAIMRAVPTEIGYRFALNADTLEWIREPDEPIGEEELTDSEALSILMGGEII